jgi:hypothetical protein
VREAETLEDRLLEVSHSLEEIFKQATINEPVSEGGRDIRGQTPPILLRRSSSRPLSTSR